MSFAVSVPLSGFTTREQIDSCNRITTFRTMSDTRRLETETTLQQITLYTGDSVLPHIVMTDPRLPPEEPVTLVENDVRVQVYSMTKKDYVSARIDAIATAATPPLFHVMYVNDGKPARAPHKWITLEELRQWNPDKCLIIAPYIPSSSPASSPASPSSPSSRRTFLIAVGTAAAAAAMLGAAAVLKGCGKEE